MTGFGGLFIVVVIVVAAIAVHNETQKRSQATIKRKALHTDTQLNACLNAFTHRRRKKIWSYFKARKQTFSLTFLHHAPTIFFDGIRTCTTN